MKHSEQELLLLKEEVIQMWKFVIAQMEKSKNALLNDDKELAREVVSREKRVDLFELKIESDCENHIALYAPVAIDLRLVLSLLKITSSLERIGDFAEGIARYVIMDKTNLKSIATGAYKAIWFSQSLSIFNSNRSTRFSRLTTSLANSLSSFKSAFLDFSI
jgi:phosphate uptake regulator